MTKKYYEIEIERLCAEIIMETETLFDELAGAGIASTSTKQSDLRRLLGKVSRTDLLTNPASDALADIIVIISDERDEETLGTHAVFDGCEDPEEGPIGSIREERIFTERGLMLAGYLIGLRTLHLKKRVLLARIEAERVINRKLGY